MDILAHIENLDKRTTDIKLINDFPFDKMMLDKFLKKGLSNAGFVFPTILQSKVIPLGINGLDLIIQSKSGTGKTLIFVCILLEKYKKKVLAAQSLVLVPTRELAIQVQLILEKIGQYLPNFKAVSIIGGLDFTQDRQKLEFAKVIVGTPGRLLHLFNINVINPTKIRMLVLDEADKLMEGNYYQDFIEINKRLKIKQIIACSATFPKNMDKKLSKFMHNPLLISTEKNLTHLLGIEQFVYNLSETKCNILEMKAKVEALKNIFTQIQFKQCIIFINSQSRAESYHNLLKRDNWPTDVMYGAQDQIQRIAVFSKFRDFKTRILLTTDLMSRGIDSINVNLVINLEIPADSFLYVHRIGRAGRFGSYGKVITFITSPQENKKFADIVNSIGTGMEIYRYSSDNKLEKWNFCENEEKLKNTKKNEIDCVKPEKLEKLKTNQNSSEFISNEIQLDKAKILEMVMDIKVNHSIKNGNLFEDFFNDQHEDQFLSHSNITKQKNFILNSSNIDRNEFIQENGINSNNLFECYNNYMKTENDTNGIMEEIPKKLSNGISEQNSVLTSMAESYSDNIKSSCNIDQIMKETPSILTNSSAELNLKNQRNYLDSFKNKSNFENCPSHEDILSSSCNLNSSMKKMRKLAIKDNEIGHNEIRLPRKENFITLKDYTGEDFEQDIYSSDSSDTGDWDTGNETIDDFFSDDDYDDYEDDDDDDDEDETDEDEEEDESDDEDETDEDEEEENESDDFDEEESYDDESDEIESYNEKETYDNEDQSENLSYLRYLSAVRTDNLWFYSYLQYINTYTFFYMQQS